MLLIGSLFLVSGSTGLIYETLWIRILSLGVGSTSSSMSLVLSIFFLGLALGSFLSGKYSHKIKNPLKAYGLLEMVIGVYASFLVFPLIQLHKLIAILPLSGSLSFLGVFTKFLIVGLLLILPTVCMGATFPLLVKIFLNKERTLGKYVSILYALNTFGAVIGAFATGYLLVPSFGVLFSNYLAAFLNLAVGGTAIYLSSRKDLAVEAKQKEEETGFRLGSLNFRSSLILLSTFICGFVSISCEVIWNKYLNIFLGTNIYGIGLVLALFLLGIALGSLILSQFVEKVQNKFSLFMWLLFLSGVTLLCSSLLLNKAPELSIVLQAYTKGHVSLLTMKTLVVTLILLLPTSIFGMLFPLSITLITSSTQNAPGILGLAYAVNTVGAILGSYITGIFLIPVFGSSFALLTSLILSCVLLVILCLSIEERKTERLAVAVFTFVFATVAFKASTLDYKNLIKSAYQQSGYKMSEKQPAVADYLKVALKPYSESHEEFKLIIEGETAVISLSHDPADGENYRNYFRLKTSGLNESVYNMENLEELPKYEALIAFLPYLFSKAPKQAFVVGYGGGFTVDFLTDTDLRKVNVVELEKGILKAADYVYKGNNPLLTRPNLNLKVEDARYVLAAKLNGPQDIIISQPSHSWLSGAANLFTEEFFEVVKDNLAEQGIFSQWLNLYNMDVTVLQSILKTFYTVFPHGAVFTQLGDQEMVLIGSKRPLDLNLKKLEAITQNQIFRKKLAGVFGHSSYDVVSLFSLSREEALKLAKDATINTDINAFAEVEQSKLFYEGLGTRETPQHYLSRVFRGDYGGITKSADNEQFYYNLLLSLNQGGHYDKFNVVLNKYEEKVKNQPSEYASLGYLCFRAGRFESAFEYLSKALKQKADKQNFNLLLSTLTEQQRYGEVEQWYNKYKGLADKSSDCYLANALVREKKLKEADIATAKIVADVNGYTLACGDIVNKMLGSYFLQKQNPTIAIPFLEAYYKAHNLDVTNLKDMLAAYTMINDTGNLKIFQDYLPQVVQSEIKTLEARIEFFKESGLTKDAQMVEATLKKLQRKVDSE